MNDLQDLEIEDKLESREKERLYQNRDKYYLLEHQVKDLQTKLTEKDKQIEELREIKKAIAEDKINLKEDLFRERKKNTELEAQLEREKNLNQCLSDNNEQLREMIEKMKCCTNCKHSRTEYEHCRTDKHEKWELAE